MPGPASRGGPKRTQQAGQAAAAPAGLQPPDNTPTPETPLTKLTARPSTTPGMQPLSPGAAAAVLQVGGTAPIAADPSSPRGSGAKRAAAALAAAAAALDAPPQSPRSGAKRNGGMSAAAEALPVSPRARQRSAAAQLGSSGDDSEGQQAAAEHKQARGGPGRRRRRAAAASDSSTDSEDEAADDDSSGGASDSAEDAVRQRPRRAARKAALFSQADYAFDDEAAPLAPAGNAFVATSIEALAAFVHPAEAAGPGGAPGAAAPAGAAAAAAPAGPPAPVRRRRKPVVAAQAPTGGCWAGAGWLRLAGSVLVAVDGLPCCPAAGGPPAGWAHHTHNQATSLTPTSTLPTPLQMWRCPSRSRPQQRQWPRCSPPTPMLS